MIKTALRRWWLINRLFHFSKHHFGMVAPRDEFLDWMVGIDIHHRITSWYTGTTKIGRFQEWLTWQLYNSRAARKHRMLPDTKISELRGLIDECVDKKLITVITGNKLALTHIGLEQYSVSYLGFGNWYAKTIWTGIIVSLVAGWVIWFTTDRLTQVVPPTITVQLQGEGIVSTSTPDF